MQHSASTRGETIVGTISTRRTRGRLAAAALLALLVASGCGLRESGPGSTSSAAPPPVSTPAPPADGGVSAPAAGAAAVTPDQSATGTPVAAAPTVVTGQAPAARTAGG